MPSLGADMTHGRLLEWRVRPGDRVRRGDIVALVDTDKAAIEVEVFEDGVVEALLVAEGERVPVGEALARLVSAGPQEAAETRGAVEVGARERRAGAAAVPSVPGRTIEAGPEPPREPAEKRPALGPAEPGARVRASPAARVLAAEEGVDLTRLTGTGPDGAVVRADVERAAAAAVAVPREHPHRVSPLAREVAAERGVKLEDVLGTGPAGAVTREDVERAAERMEAAARMVAPEGEEDARRQAMRRAIAAAVTRSNREIPHYWVSARIDMSRALEWMAARNIERPLADRLLPAALLLRAVALSLRVRPELNGFWENGAFRAGEGVHLGVAISLRGGGLIAPAIRAADTLTLDETMRALNDLVQRARSGGLRGSELTSATVTVTNLGERGAEAVFGVIYPPQVALVGFGSITEQPWAEEGMLGVRPVVTATLAADHRATDGHLGSLFLAEVRRRMQKPEEL
jgi:pyruvate dehydrogenase E2 component (dihydrolipoamide acetyltransferase)